jgi:oxygen-independent coproporphyrinogen-3 oxidase
VVLVGGADADQQVARWVDWNIKEARLWLERVPNLGTAPVGEFNVFGGTPALASAGDVHRLLDFYRENFGFGPDTTIRFEGDPKSLSDAKLAALAAAGVTKLSCGVQSFDDHVLGLSGRQHAARDCVRFLRSARDLGFEWVSVDLMYGLLDQTLDSVRRDLDVVLAEQPTAVVCTKLHLRSYADTRTGVSGAQPAAWQSAAYRERMTRAGHHWPTLGEQYQMREILTDGLRANNYVEHPTMYFAQAGRGPEKWKSIMVDQERQDAEVAIGLGGSSSCRRSEAITEVNWRRYAAAVDAGEVPLASATSFSPDGQEARSIRMALSTLRPLRADLHERRFPGRSLLTGPWRERFVALRDRGLLTIDEAARVITLNPVGETLVEAIINTDLAD